MENISPEFNTIDALLLYSVASCQRRNEKATLSQILLVCDGAYRVTPRASEFEDGFNKLIAGRYIEVREDMFVATKPGMRLFKEITNPQNPKLHVVAQIRNLTNRLNKSRLRTVSKQITITDDQVSEANREAHAIVREFLKQIVIKKI